jgi:hypothetical protein
MTSDNLPAHESLDHIKSITVHETLELGQWYWVATDKGERLACVDEIGSNFVQLTYPSKGNRGSHVFRVHLKDFWTDLRREDNAQAYLDSWIRRNQELANQHLAEIKAVTARLGVSAQPRLPGTMQSGSTALAVVSGTTDVKAYENALVKAQKETLPALFEAVKAANAEVTRWMLAATLPMQAQAEQMQGVVGAVKDRIFNVSLYAGLAEDVWQCSDGEPAAFHEKLHVFQRRLYMDEECLLNYRVGGMDFNSVHEFDAWIALPENRDRILPMPRCMVAMRVRRNTKQRDADDLNTALINLKLENADKLTFLYVRNGERVYCLQTELEFDEDLFPSRSDFNPAEPMMFKMFCNRVDKIISKALYDQLVAEKKERRLKSKQWLRDNPEETWDRSKGDRDFANPFKEWGFDDLDRYEPLDPSSVYYDEAMGEIERRIKKYNRIATIIQGLFDRSEILHPHPPVQTWTADGFARAIELVYDGDTALVNGEAPDFEAYRARCNTTLKQGSIVVGQDDFWELIEGERECARRDRNWRQSREYRPERFRPYGNPGPGYVARIAEWRPKAKSAIFRWTRDRIAWNRDSDEPISCTLTVPAEKLLNIDAYKPGDFKQFFADHRTRAQYLKWAHLLLTAEEYHAGNVKVGETKKGFR